jgi:sugar phosphate isomerase/epimerase
VHLVLPSTTSHKHEALIPTLDLFARLGFTDLDLNLNHIVERGAGVDEIRSTLDANDQRVWIASGGWCDFFDEGVKAGETEASVERQIALARRLGVDRLRLFFGRLPFERYTAAASTEAAAGIRRIADRHPEMTLLFENHDGASSRPEVCKSILEAVDRANVRLIFDPINFEHRGVRTLDALTVVQPLIGHVHLKGYVHVRQGSGGQAGGEFCGFGEGDVDLQPALRALIAGGYRGDFTVEYEGAGDRTLRLYESVRRARASLSSLLAPVR